MKWDFIPKPRNGPTLKDMSDDQPGPAKGMLADALSASENNKALTILSLDNMRKTMVTAAQRRAVLQKFEGIPYSELNEKQKAGLVELIGLYANRLRPELAQDDMRRVTEAGLDKIYFAWAGVTEPGKGHYYRIHGPNVLIEYDDTQNDANHIHTVWRDLENDFGGDVLKRHYEESHK